MDFDIFRIAVEKQFKKMMEDKSESLFTVTIDYDKMWNLYLDSIPENPIVRKRREYDCSCCRSFLKKASKVILIKNGEISTIFDSETLDSKWNMVLKAMREYILSCPIDSYFCTNEKYFGTDQSIEYDKENSRTIRWKHLYSPINKKYILGNSSSIEEARARIRGNQGIFYRSLQEISQEALLTVIELCNQGSLYKGEEWKETLEKFLSYKREYDHLSSERERVIYTWEKNTKNLGENISHMKNTSMGSLLMDISQGRDLDEAVRRYEAMVAPSNYKRPKPLFTQKMLEEAKKTIINLGYGDSLQRRFASLSDITVNNILYCDRDSSSRIHGSSPKDIFDELAMDSQKSSSHHNKFSRVEEVNINTFIKDILPSVTSMEAYIEGAHSKNFCSLIAPCNMESKSMFKWGNSFSWAYTGNMTDSDIKNNVKSAGGKVDGVLRFSIQWNDIPEEYDANDLDAHCREPNGNEIYYVQKFSPYTKGNLDIDIINPSPSTPAVENITWPEIEKMDDGVYKFWVHCFTHRGGRGGFRAEIEYNGEIFTYNYSHPLRQGENVDVAYVTLKDGNFSIEHKMEMKPLHYDIWGVRVNSFTPVSVMCLSPNFWDSEKKGVGNKHYMFMLKGCVNPEKPNGWYNEFLVSELEGKHKRVMEALASKAYVEDTDDQLSGVGFSSSQRNSLVVKVKGAFERVLRIKF